MKINVYLKDPDGFSNDVDEAVQKHVDEVPGLDKSEREAVFEQRREKIWKSLEKWVDCQEYVGIDFDTEAGTAVVVERKR